MESLAAAPRHRQRQVVLTACLAVVLMAGQAVGGEIVGAPIDLSAFVHEALIPGGTIFEDTHSVTGALTTPKQSAVYLYLASQGENFSGRSTNIQRAFASALAESDRNGGVCVTSWIGPNPSNTNPGAIEQLVSQATWKQNFTYNGTVPVPISLHLNIPAVQVGLIGVPPRRDEASVTETAEANATLTSTIIHPDLTTSPVTSFEFGMRAFETQLPSGPGPLFNFADYEFMGVNDRTQHLFEDAFIIKFIDPFDPRFDMKPVSTDVQLGKLQPGDTVSYTYQLTAQGTTTGRAQGYVAFLGDPFGLDVTSGNLVLSIASVPEPATGILSVIGLVCIVVCSAAVGRRR